MAAKLTPAQREDAILKAWQMSLRGATTTKISQELGISAKGICRLLKTARDRAQKQNEAEMAGYLAEFVGEQRAVIEAAWERLGKVPGQLPQRRLDSVQYYFSQQEHCNGSRRVCRAHRHYLEGLRRSRGRSSSSRSRPTRSTR